MTEPREFLSIGLWLVGAICLVALEVYLLDGPPEVIYATLGVGIGAAIAESLHAGGRK